MADGGESTAALPEEHEPERWDFDYDSSTSRPLLRHGYWPVLASWSLRDFHSRYRQSGLRTLWTLWQPLSIVAINGIFFHSVLKVNGAGLPYLVFIVAGIMAYRYVASGLGAATVIFDNANVITKAYFPKEIIPLSSMVVSLIDLGVMLAALIVLAIAQGVGLSYTIVALPLVLLLLLLFTAALTLFLSAVTVFVRDVAYLLPTVSQLLFLGSPIMYPTSQLPLRFRWVNSVNPLAVVVESARDVVLRHRWPSWPLLFVQLAVCGALALAALWYLRALENRMADVA